MVLIGQKLYKLELSNHPFMIHVEKNAYDFDLVTSKNGLRKQRRFRLACIGGYSHPYLCQ